MSYAGQGNSLAEIQVSREQTLVAFVAVHAALALLPHQVL